jgi:hypothetical protein
VINYFYFILSFSIYWFKLVFPIIIMGPPMLITITLLYGVVPEPWFMILVVSSGLLSFYLFLKLLDFIFNREKHKDD